LLDPNRYRIASDSVISNRTTMGWITALALIEAANAWSGC
jgi:hypothetical protein